MLNLNDKAYENFRMINPIEHARTKEQSLKYKVEPYVVAADVYGQGNLAGRGGWTWYTGSSAWMYIAGIKYILGIDIENGYLEIKPHIPSSWDGFGVRYKYGASIYNITIINENRGVVGLSEIKKMKCNGEEIEEEKIRMNSNGGIYNIEIFI